MTDKELLEKAAKVVGLDGHIHEWINGPEFIISGENPATWNPLADDGDALRLAVKLNMFDGSLFDVFKKLRLEETRLNPNRADDEITRRAITRTAAMAR